MRGKPIPDIKVVESMAASSSSNSRGSRGLHIALRALAIVFAAATVLYTWFWMAALRLEEPPAVELGLDGRPVEDAADQARVWKRHEPGDSIRLTILRPGQTAPLELTGVFRRNSELAATPGTLQGAVRQLSPGVPLPLAFL